MNLAEFDEFILEEARRKSREIADTAAVSESDMRSVSERVSCGFAETLKDLDTRIARIKGEISRAASVRERCAANAERAANSRRAVPPLPEPPAVTDNTREAEARYAARKAEVKRQRDAAERHNRDCDIKYAAAEKAIRETDGAITVLEESLHKLMQERDKLAREQDAFESVRGRSAASMRKVVTEYSHVSSAVARSADAAEDLLAVRADYGVGSVYGAFSISAGSAPVSGYCGSAGNATFAIDHADEKGDSDIPDGGAMRDIVVKCKSRKGFFEAVDGESYGTIKIPAANLHSLGGTDFLDEMKSLGYDTVTRGGSMIGADGFITFAKK